MFHHDTPIPIIETDTEVYVFREVSQSVREQGTVDWVEGLYDNKGPSKRRGREKGKYRLNNFIDNNTVAIYSCSSNTYTFDKKE